MTLDDFTEDFENEDADTYEVREDKIFNNSYYNGDKLKDPDEYEFSKKIAVASDYSDNYLKDLYDYEEQLESKFILDVIFELFQKDDVLSKYTEALAKGGNSPKVKLTKEDVNLIFNTVHEKLDLAAHGISFYSPIYILEAISSISSMEYKKIFDALDTEIQEILIIELNKKYRFLDGKMNKKKIH